MGTTTQLTDFRDLYTDLQNRAREQTGIAATENQAKRYINIALQDMHLGQGEKLSWAERTATLITKAQYTTGTAAIIQSGSAVTGAGTFWNTTSPAGNVVNVIAGGKIVFDGGKDVYRVASVASDTALTVASRFISTSVTAATYLYFEDEYELATDFLRPIDQQKFDNATSIDLVGRTEFRRRYPANKTTGKPHIGTIIDIPFEAGATGSITAFTNYSTLFAGTTLVVVSGVSGLFSGQEVVITGTTNYNGTYNVVTVTPLSFYIKKAHVGTETGTWTRVTSERRLVLHPPPSEIQMIRYSYVTSNLGVTALGAPIKNLENDTDEPIVPLQYRHAIVFHALSHWYRDKKDDPRSQEVANEYTSIMMRVLSDSEIGGAKPQFRPRLGTYRRRAKRPWRGGTGRYDINGEFDRFER